MSWATRFGIDFRSEGATPIPGAVPTLAWRMKQSPLNLYNKDLDPEYRQDDNERVVGARMLADLAILHPPPEQYGKCSQEGYAQADVLEQHNVRRQQ